MIKKCLAEFISTFMLVFFGTAAIVVNQLYANTLGHVGVSIVFGLVVAILIYCFGDISGAHMNPAVTIALCATKRSDRSSCIAYLGSQLSGAIFASIIVSLLFPKSITLGATYPNGSYWTSFTLEFLLSFVLMLVVCRIALSTNNSPLLAGAVIGATVLIEAMIGGPISGASMNPARSIGPALVSGNLNAIELYIVSPTLAMISATLLDGYLFQ